MIEHDGYYYFLRPITGVYGKIRWSVVKRPIAVTSATTGHRGGKFYKATFARTQKAMAVSALETSDDEVLATGLTTEEADNYLKLLR